MWIEQPPFLYRLFFPEAIWRIPGKAKRVFLTFDDGPIPEVTPWVLNLLDHYQIKATFFCVGDNVRKYPAIYQDILSRGHQVGNHTMHHIQAPGHSLKSYMRDIAEASTYISSSLFRPPHGWMKYAQLRLVKRAYQIIMWDVVTRDYSKKRNSDQVFDTVKRYTRNGSILVFHDSLKAEKNLRGALARSLEWLLSEGYVFETIHP